MTMLPALSQLQVVSRKSEDERKFKLSWGAKTEGIQAGDHIDGIILGFIENEYKTKNIILKSFNENGQQVTVWGCSTLTKELHVDDSLKDLLYGPGDVVRITYKGSYMGKKGLGKDKMIAVFRIDELIGYELTEQDVHEIKAFQQEKIKTMPLVSYKPAPATTKAPAYTTPAYKIAAMAKKPIAQMGDDDSFDV